MKKKFCCDKRVFTALVDLSEVVYALVSLNCNYSQETSSKLSKALRSINNIIEGESQ